jgi:hypothetical protein
MQICQPLKQIPLRIKNSFLLPTTMSIKAALLTCVRVLQYLLRDFERPWLKIQVILNILYIFVYCARVGNATSNISTSKFLLIERQRRILWEVIKKALKFTRNIQNTKKSDCKCEQGTLIPRECGHYICLKCYLTRLSGGCGDCANNSENKRRSNMTTPL